MEDMKRMEPATLPALNVDPSSLLFIGFSSGCAFAHQEQIVNSDKIAGVGLIMGDHYYNKALGIGSGKENPTDLTESLKTAH